MFNQSYEATQGQLRKRSEKKMQNWWFVCIILFLGMYENMCVNLGIDELNCLNLKIFYHKHLNAQ